MARASRVVVTQDEQEPVERIVLAKAIENIGKAAEALAKSGLNEKGIVVLLADKTKLGKGVIEAVLEGLADLRREYTR